MFVERFLINYFFVHFSFSMVPGSSNSSTYFPATSLKIFTIKARKATPAAKVQVFPVPLFPEKISPPISPEKTNAAVPGRNPNRVPKKKGLNSRLSEVRMCTCVCACVCVMCDGETVRGKLLLYIYIFWFRVSAAKLSKLCLFVAGTDRSRFVRCTFICLAPLGRLIGRLLLRHSLALSLSASPPAHSPSLNLLTSLTSSIHKSNYWG